MGSIDLPARAVDRRISRRAFLRTAIIGSATLGLSLACGPGTPGTPTAAPAASTKPTEAPAALVKPTAAAPTTAPAAAATTAPAAAAKPTEAPKPAAAAAETPRRGGELTFVVSAEPP